MTEASILEMKQCLSDKFAEKEIILKCKADNFSVSKGFLERNKKWLLESYDMSLFMGIFHHLKTEAEWEREISPLIQRTNCYIVSRGACFQAPAFRAWIKKYGFDLAYEKKGLTEHPVGTLTIFQRQIGI